MGLKSSSGGQEGRGAIRPAIINIQSITTATGWRQQEMS